MQRICNLFWMPVLLTTAVFARAEQVQINAVNYDNKPTAQVEFQLSASAHHRFFTLNHPSRLVVDFNNTKLAQALAAPPVDHPLFQNVRTSLRNDKDLRVVFELKADAGANENLIKQANGSHLQFNLTLNKPIIAKEDHPVVATVSPTPAPAAPVTITAAPMPMTASVAKNKPATPTPVLAVKTVNVKPTKPKGRDIIVAIDAGHGGKDVGAQGNNGTQEKDVVFAIAKRLENMVNNQAGMRAVMIRKGDYFVKLHDRVRIAQEQKADLFVSIHADAFIDSSAHGASVYTLANKGASSQGARWLADSENASDFAGGVAEQRDDTLASVLQDLTKSAAKEVSQNIGNKVLRSVKSVGHLHRNSVQRAGFVVLKSPEIPSILVETAFISNPEEERHLNTSAYQQKMASAVFGGILAHFRQYAPANTLMAQQSKSGKSPHLAVVEAPKTVAENDKSLQFSKAAPTLVSTGKSQPIINLPIITLRHANAAVTVVRPVKSLGNAKTESMSQIPRSG